MQHGVDATIRSGFFEEDLSANMALVSGIALNRCNGCADYHVSFVARRLVKEDGAGGRRAEAVAEIAAPYLKARAMLGGRVDILVAGAADTRSPAAAANAAAAAGLDALRRLHLTVIDRCGTPLELAQHYAERVGVTLSVAAVDLVDPNVGFDADLVLVDSLFRHIPHEHHVGICERMVSWLKPGGAILFSSPVGERDKNSKLRQRLDEEEEMLRIFAERDQQFSEPLADVMARCRRERSVNYHIGDYESLDELNRLFADAGLTVVQQRTDRLRRGGKGMRVLSLLSPA